MPPRRSKRTSKTNASSDDDEWDTPWLKKQRIRAPPLNNANAFDAALNRPGAVVDTSFTDSLLPSSSAPRPVAAPFGQPYMPPSSSAPAAITKAEERAYKAAEKARAKAEKDAIKARDNAVKAEAKRIKNEEKRVKDEQKRIKAAAASAKRQAKQRAQAEREARIGKLRWTCPQATIDRMERVMTQRMFMVEREIVSMQGRAAEKFAVLGSTGNVYTVHIRQKPTCDCVDFIRGNHPCKHVIFVFLKVLKVAEDSHIWFQRTLTEDELADVFVNAPPIVGAAEASEQVRSAYKRAIGREAPEAEEAIPDGMRNVVGEDCPICFEEMDDDDVANNKITYDTEGCRNGLHKQCWDMWANSAKSRGASVTCVWCRSPWPGTIPNKGKGKVPGRPGATGLGAIGYINMADEAGMSRTRDTSTYYHGPKRGEPGTGDRYDD